MDELTINGLVEIQSDDIYANYVTVYNDLTVFGNQIFNGNQIVDGNLTVSGNSLLNTLVVQQGVSFNNNLYVSGDTNLNNLNVSGILNLTNLTIGGNATFDNNVHIGGDLSISGNLGLLNLDLAGNLSVSGSSNFASPLTINRDSLGIRSELVLNYGASSTGTRVGIFYNQNSSTSAKYPLISTDSLGDGLVYVVPNNTLSSIRLRPDLSTTSENFIILQKPNGLTQNIESNLGISGNLNITGNLNLSGLDYKQYFSATGGYLSYNNNGEYSLTQGDILQAITAGSGIAISSTGVISSNDPSKWSITANTIYPKDNYNINQLVIGLTGEGNTSSLAHFKGSTRTNMMIESSNIAYSPQITLKNAGGGNGYIKSILNRLDLDVGNNNSLSVLDGQVGINKINPDYELEVSNVGSSTDTVITSYNNQSNGYAGMFLRNDLGAGGIMFMNGSTRTSDGGAKTFSIRNDQSAPVRIQNNNFFENTGNQLDLVGEPLANSQIWGGGHNVYPNKFIYDADTTLYYLYGEYNSNTFINVPNLDGSSSGYTLPSTGGVQNLFIVVYQSDGTVYNTWRLNTNRACISKNIVIDDNATGWVWICGQYANNGVSPVIPDLYSGTSLFTLPSTGAGNFVGFLIGFNRSTGAVQYAWTTNNTTSGTIYDSVNDIIVLPSSRIIIVGTISPNGVFNINHLNNFVSAYNWTSSGGQCAFALRFNPKIPLSLTAYYQWTADNSFHYSIAYNKGAGDNRIIITGVYYNFVGRTLINFGNGASAFGINAGITGNTLAIRFNNPESDVLNNMTVSGRWEVNNNIGISRIQESLIRFNPITQRYVYYSMYFSNNPITIYTDLANRTVAGYTLKQPENSTWYGCYLLEFDNTANGNVYTVPSTFYTATSNQNDISEIRFDSLGNTYVIGYLFNTGVQIKPFFYNQGGTKLGFDLKEGFNISFCYVYAPNLKSIGFQSNLNNVGATKYRDLLFIPNSSTNDFYMIGYSLSNSQTYMGNFENYSTGFTIPTSIGFYSVLQSTFTKKITTLNFFNNNGVGIGRANNGLCQLEVEHGIYTPSKIICNQFETNTEDAPIFRDFYGREIGQLAKVVCCLNAVNSANIRIKNSINVYGVQKFATGYYTVLYSKGCPYGANNYTTNVSSTSYTRTNMTVFPFIATDATAIGIPLNKPTFGCTITTCNTAGTGFDMGDINFVAYW